MEDLIKALQIFLKYGNPKHPLGCSSKRLEVMVNPFNVSYRDIVELKKLGFEVDEGNECFYSDIFIQGDIDETGMINLWGGK